MLVRKSLGLEAFGINIVELPPGGSIPEHHELDRAQEEVFYVIEGAPTMTVDGADVELEAGTFVRLDPEPLRTVRNDGDESRARADHLGSDDERLRGDGLGVTAGAQPPMYDISTFDCGAVCSERISE